MPRPKQPRNVYLARQLRADQTAPEARLWRLLRGQPDGVNIRRQHPIGSYVLDFYCAAARIAFEIDGIAHDMADRPLRDTDRDRALAELGIEVVRIPASDVLRSPQEIAEALVRYCKGK
jgi:very-short-patch-repair endonuclease